MTQKLITGLNRLEDGLLLLLVMALVGLASSQIVLRNLFDSGIGWAESALRILVLWIALVGATRATRSSGHIAIDLIQRYWNSTSGLWFQRLIQLISASVCAVASYHSYQLVLLEKEDGMTSFLDTPVWIWEAIIPLCLALIGLRLFLYALTGHSPVQHENTHAS